MRTVLVKIAVVSRQDARMNSHGVHGQGWWRLSLEICPAPHSTPRPPPTARPKCTYAFCQGDSWLQSVQSWSASHLIPCTHIPVTARRPLCSPADNRDPRVVFGRHAIMSGAVRCKAALACWHRAPHRATLWPFMQHLHRRRPQDTIRGLLAVAPTLSVHGYAGRRPGAVQRLEA